MRSTCTSDSPLGKFLSHASYLYVLDYLFTYVLAFGFLHSSVSWESLDEFLHGINRYVCRVRGDGFCFLRAIQRCLGEVNIPISFAELRLCVLNEITRDLQFYSQFATIEPYRIEERVNHFFSVGTYQDSVVDLIVHAMANALLVNVHILFCSQNCVRIHSIRSDLHRSYVNVFLLFTGQGAGAHYDSILQYPSVFTQEDEEDQPLDLPYPEHLPPTMHETLVGHDAVDILELDEVSSSRPSSSLSDRPPSCLAMEKVDGSQSSSSSTCSAPDLSFSWDPKDFVLTPANLPTSNRRYGTRGHFDYTAFLYRIPEEVDCVPRDIDGTQLFFIRVTDTNWKTKKVDQRWFEMYTSQRSGFKGTSRRRGQCMGNFICGNVACPKVIASGCERSISAIARGGKHFCRTCGEMLCRSPCDAVKIVEYYKNRGVLLVYHFGNHRCVLRGGFSAAEKLMRDEILEEAFRLNPKSRVADVQEGIISQYISQGRIEEAQMAAKLLLDRNYISKKKYEMFAHHYEGQRNTILGVQRVKQKTDEVDCYHIYKVNEERTNPTAPTFVFKSSKVFAKLALRMDRNLHPGHPMVHEYAFLDGIHRRCRNFKTLTLWTYTAATNSIVRLATMEVEHENTECIELFLSIYNEVLAEVSGIVGYKFNPIGFLVDAAGANFAGLEKVFGHEVCKKIVTCQWHYLRDVKRTLTKICADDKLHFMQLAQDLMQAATMKEYTTISEAMLSILKKDVNAAAMNWFKWWDVRRFHLVPAFRGFNIPGTNLAEAGQSSLKNLKGQGAMMLVDAAFKDVVTMMLQEERYIGYLKNQHGITGRGLNQQQVMARKKFLSETRAEQYIDALDSGDLYDESFQEQNPDFIPPRPSEMAKHRAPKRYNVDNPQEVSDVLQKDVVRIPGDREASSLMPVPMEEGDAAAPLTEVTSASSTTPKGFSPPVATTTTAHPKKHGISVLAEEKVGNATYVVAPSPTQPGKFILYRSEKFAQLEKQKSKSGTTGSTLVKNRKASAEKSPAPPMKTVTKAKTATPSKAPENTKPISAAARSLLPTTNGPSLSSIISASTDSTVTAVVPSSSTTIVTSMGTWTFVPKVGSASGDSDTPQVGKRRATSWEDLDFVPASKVLHGNSRGGRRGRGNVRASSMTVPRGRRTARGARGGQARTLPGSMASPPGRRGPMNNPPILVFWKKGITTCYGCKRKFTREHKAPMDLLFKMNVKRSFPNGRGGMQVARDASATYFHSMSMNCLQRQFSYLEKRDVFMHLETLDALSPAHIDLLKERGLWDHLQANRALYDTSM